MAASNATLQALHEAVAQGLLEIITEGVPMKWDDDGEVTARRKASAAEFGAAIKLLSDNNITAKLEDNDALQALQKVMEANRAKGDTILHDFMSGDYGPQ